MIARPIVLSLEFRVYDSARSFAIVLLRCDIVVEIVVLRFRLDLSIDTIRLWCLNLLRCC